jgi:hypothetical protein
MLSPSLIQRVDDWVGIDTPIRPPSAESVSAVVAAQPDRTSAAAAATAAILVIFLSNCVVPFDLPAGPAEHFFLSSVHPN